MHIVGSWYRCLIEPNERTGVRRVHTDRADGGQGRRRGGTGAEGGEGHGGEQEPAAVRVRHGGDGQGRRGEQVPRRRHLRRRPRPRRTRLRATGTLRMPVPVNRSRHYISFFFSRKKAVPFMRQCARGASLTDHKAIVQVQCDSYYATQPSQQTGN